MSNILVHNNISFCLTTFDGVEEVYNVIREEINNLAINNNVALPEEVAKIEDLDKNVWLHVKGTSYYVHKTIVPVQYIEELVYLKAITKIACMELYKYPKDMNSDVCFVNYIYSIDKASNLKARGLDRTYVDRLDFFVGSREIRKSGNNPGQYIVRQGGTRHGGTARGSIRRSEFRQNNTEYLRVLMNGPKSVNRKLHCPMTMIPMEGYHMKNVMTGEQHEVNCYELHHAKFFEGKSQTKKGVEPSSHLNSMTYSNFTPEVINESLGLVALSTAAHSMLHKHTVSDDLQGWLGRYEQGQLNTIPYHWKSESNYNTTVNWLTEKCDNYKQTDSISWEDFNAENSFNKSQIDEIINKLPEDVAKNAVFNFAGLDRNFD